jgi:hypothetical protein
MFAAPPDARWKDDIKSQKERHIKNLQLAVV